MNIQTLHLLFVNFRYMRGRNAYNLKKLLAVYNLGQVIACGYLIYGILSNNFNVIKFWKCQPVIYHYDPKSIAALTYAYHTFLLKLIELFETAFFVLRKKQNQVSKLHVYHHVSTAILGYIMTKYIGGELTTIFRLDIINDYKCYWNFVFVFFSQQFKLDEPDWANRRHDIVFGCA